MAELDFRSDDEKRLVKPDSATRAPWKAWYDSLLGQECVYCGDIIGEQTRKHPDFCLDRVPQCEFCNTVKYNNPPETLVALAHDVLHHLDDPMFVSPLTQRVNKEPSPYDRWVKACGYKNLTVHITEQQRDTILRQPCTYCGLPEGGGIDRIDCGREIAIGSIQPCCYSCSRMKLVLPHSATVAKLQAIVARHPHRPKNARPCLPPPQKPKRRKIK
jgi:hypothetical protein